MCQRDIVQFVPYNKYGGNPQLLAAELLRQIPKQVTQYFVNNMYIIEFYWKNASSSKQAQDVIDKPNN